MAKIIYCDHSHNFLEVQNIDSTVVGEDIRLNNIGMVTLSKENYSGNDDYVIDTLERNTSVRLDRYDCPYCRALGKGDLAFMFHPDLGNRFIRLRKTTDEWEIEDTPKIGVEEMFGDSAYVLEYE